MGGGFEVDGGVGVAPEEEHEGYKGRDGDGGCGEEVGEGGFAAFLGDCGAVAWFVVGWCGDGEDGDDLCYTWQHARYRLPRHDRLCVIPHAEARYVCEDAVLAQSGCQAGGEDDGHEEAEVEAWGDGAEGDG